MNANFPKVMELKVVQAISEPRHSSSRLYSNVFYHLKSSL